MSDRAVIHERHGGELSALDDEALAAMERDPAVSRTLLVAVVVEQARRRRERAAVRPPAGVEPAPGA